MITIVNYGLGNLGSIVNLFKRLGFAAQISANPAEVAAASRLVLPGVGRFDYGMTMLQRLELIPALQERVLARGVPMLGICLGMQLFCQSSEEGDVPGLGWLKARTVRFQALTTDGPPLRIPHMGWNTVRALRSHPLLKSLDGESRFYFAHSYHLQADDANDVLGITEYGVPFPAIIARGNIMGVQFHPEKSHRFGMALLKNFAEMPA